MTTIEFFTIKISSKKVELELTANQSTWCVYCKADQDFEFSGSVYNGHYNHNQNGIVMYCDAKEFTFFEDEIRKNVEKILRKNKILKK